MYRKNLMRVCLAAIMAATVVTTSVPVYAADESPVKVVKKNAETVEVTFIDEETKAPVGEKINVEIKDGMINTGSLEAPKGYEVCVPGDVLVKDGDSINVEVRKVVAEAILVITFETADGEKVGNPISVTSDDELVEYGKDYKLPEGYTFADGYEMKDIPVILGTTGGHTVKVKLVEETVEITFIDEETKAPVGEKINVEVKDGMINTGRLTAPEGYEVCVPGDVFATPGTSLNVEARKVVAKTVEVTFIDEETKAPVGEKINVEVKDGMINTGRLTAPEGYEVCVKGDVPATAGAGLNVEVRKAEKTVYVSYIDEETKMPLENAIEKIKLPADAKSFNTSILKKVPAGYELCVVGDIAFEGDSLNVEVRKAERTVYVSYIDEETKIPFENGIEEIKVAKDATMFNTSLLKEVPEGYELCELGDVYIGENDTVNVEVRKLAAEEKTVYVSYIDEETKMPFENGIETIKLAKNATYFNTSLLKEVPAGYELCEVGDVYIGENDTVNVEVRKIKEEPETPVDPDKPVNPEKPEKPGKPVKPQEDDKDKDNQKDDKKDEDDKKSPKTSDEASPLAATATAGLSLAAILALLKKRR